MANARFTTKYPKLVIGQRYGRLVAIEPTSIQVDGHVYWHFLCDCGTDKIISEMSVRRGKSRSCGCQVREAAMKKTKTTLTPGERYGRLVVVEWTGTIGFGKNSKSIWKFRCDCGALRFYQPNAVRSGNTKSCGCYHSDGTAARNRARWAYRRRPNENAQLVSPEKRSWTAMKQRCSNPNNPAYDRYGGRGISVCERWFHSFDAFLADMGPRPSLAHSLDRIDNDGDYEPTNCRWSTDKVQSRNRRNSTIIDTPWGAMTCAEAAERAGISMRKVWRRWRSGWSIADTLNPDNRAPGMPPKKRSPSC